MQSCSQLHELKENSQKQLQRLKEKAWLLETEPDSINMQQQNTESDDYNVTWIKKVQNLCVPIIHKREIKEVTIDFKSSDCNNIQLTGPVYTFINAQ